MHPILLELGPLKLYTYGLLVASGFYIGILLIARTARREGVDPNFIFDTAFWTILSAILGSRLVYVVLNYPYYLIHPLDVFKIWAGGLVFYGGFAGAAIAVIVCVRKAKLDIWHVADIIAPGAALGHSFGRVGCFFAGCCYGKQTDVSWSVTFHDALSIAPTGVHLHPTQLYSAANEFMLFALLTLLWPYRKFKGQIFLTWVILYGVTRSTIEVFRGDPRGVYFDGLVSTSQIIAAFVVPMAIWLFMKNRKIHRLG